MGISRSGISRHGIDFICAYLSGVLRNGATLTLRIDDIAPLDGDNADVLACEIWVDSDGGRGPLCGYELDGSVRRSLAVPRGPRPAGASRPAPC